MNDGELLRGRDTYEPHAERERGRYRKREREGRGRRGGGLLRHNSGGLLGNNSYNYRKAFISVRKARIAWREDPPPPHSALLS